MPALHILAFALLVLAALLALRASANLQQRLESSALADPLSLAYLQAWLQAAPGDRRLRLLLARQQLREGQLNAALATLAPLRQGGPRVEVETLQLEILSQRLWQTAPRTPAFAAARTAVRAQLVRLGTLPLAPPQLEALANQAIALADLDQALVFYRRLLALQPYETVRLQADIAALLLAQGRYEDAAAAYLLAMDHALSRDEQRRLYRAGLSALQSGNRLAQALATAQARGQQLHDDPATLEFLTHLARAANRPDLAEQYVDRLLQAPARLGGGPQ